MRDILLGMGTNRYDGRQLSQSFPWSSNGSFLIASLGGSLQTLAKNRLPFDCVVTRGLVLVRSNNLGTAQINYSARRRLVLEQ